MSFQSFYITSIAGRKPLRSPSARGPSIGLRTTESLPRSGFRDWRFFGVLGPGGLSRRDAPRRLNIRADSVLAEARSGAGPELFEESGGFGSHAGRWRRRARWRPRRRWR